MLDDESSSKHHSHKQKSGEPDAGVSNKKRHRDAGEKRPHHRSSKKHKADDDKHRHRSSRDANKDQRSSRSDSKRNNLPDVDGSDDEDIWVEKDLAEGGERVGATLAQARNHWQQTLIILFRRRY
jgi:hypothetical protein